MKIWFFILFFAITFSVSAQSSVYHPFPDSNATWNVQAQGYIGTMCSITFPIVFDFYITYFMSGDTTINNISYKKIYSFGVVHEYCLTGEVDNWSIIDTSVATAIRQEINTKKIYIYNNQESLLYDFNLNVGDTARNCDVIESIDSVLIGDNYRKRFNLSMHQYSLIEGIGSTSGLIEPLCPFEYSGTLTCFTQNELTLYPDTTFSCIPFTDIQENTIENSNATFSPNPFHSTTTLELKNDFESMNLFIFNSIGEKVLQQKIISQKMTIDRKGLPNGIYFYQLIGKENIVSGRLIIE